MDTLEGYGSESSSTANEDISQKRQESTLSGLLGSPLSGTDDEDEVVLSSPHKRQRVEDDGGIELLKQMLSLPPTPVTREQSLVHLDQDYLSTLLTSLHGNENSSANNPKSIQTKVRILSVSASGQPLARNARSGKDYYNPLFLKIVKDRFNIENPLQSRARHASSRPQHYEKQIFRKEV